MASEKDYSTTIVGLTGQDNRHISVLANLSPTVGDPDSIWSVVYHLVHRPEIQADRIYMVESWLTSMDETPSGTLAAVSMDGELHVAQNDAWRMVTLGCPDGLNAIWAASDREFFAVGLSGYRLRIVDMAPELNHDRRKRRLNAVHGTSPNNAYAVGDGGVIFHYHEGLWRELESPTNVALLAVLCHEDDVFFAGANGTLFRLSGNNWQDLHCSDEVTFTSLAWYADSLFAAAGSDGIYRLGVEGLEPFKRLIIYRLRTIGNLLFGFGNYLVAQFDGSGWWGGNLAL